jgi:hypothetical protein
MPNEMSHPELLMHMKARLLALAIRLNKISNETPHANTERYAKSLVNKIAACEKEIRDIATLVKFES